jgi:hypothetical protein
MWFTLRTPGFWGLLACLWVVWFCIDLVQFHFVSMLLDLFLLAIAIIEYFLCGRFAK